MIFRIFNLIPFYLIDADWGMLKAVVVFELDMAHYLIEGIFNSV